MVEYILCKYCDFSDNYGNCKIENTEPKVHCNYFSIDDSSQEDLMMNLKKTLKKEELTKDNSDLLKLSKKILDENIEFKKICACDSKDKKEYFLNELSKLSPEELGELLKELPFGLLNETLDFILIK